MSDLRFVGRSEVAECPVRAIERFEVIAGTRLIVPAAERTKLWTGMLPPQLANPAMLRIVPATGDRLSSALQLLFAAWPDDARSERIAEIPQEIEDGEFDPRHLLLAEFDGQPVGVQLTIMRDADVGMVWPPVVDDVQLKRINGPKTEAIEDALLTEAARQLDAVGAWIGQSLLEPNQSRDQAALQRNGFSRLTELRFFERTLKDDSPWPKRSERTSLSYEPYRRSRNRLAFVNVLEETYRGTLDCPELNGARDGQQSLKNHEAAGSFKPGMWRLYRRDGINVGILLMVDRCDEDAWEVLYVGVIESARGRGVGRAMLVDALGAARDAGVDRLLIVADVRNVPAVSLYESLGFQAAASRVACVRLRRPVVT